MDRATRKALRLLRKAEVGAAVSITWNDAYSVDDWRSAEDAREDVDLEYVVLTTGRLIEVGKKQVMLAGSCTAMGNVCSTMTIPLSWVQDVEVHGL